MNADRDASRDEPLHEQGTLSVDAMERREIWRSADPVLSHQGPRQEKRRR